VLHETADLAPAYSMRDWNARGQYVVAQLQATADRSQAGLRMLLERRGTSHQAFWIVNAIKLTADPATINEVASRPEVAQIVADSVFRIPTPFPGTPQRGVDGVEWNIDRIRAPEVWSTFGVRGEGIVVASIDTGVQYDHPALVNQYRGNQGGTFDHNYNWYDPSNVCGWPSEVPCDNIGHGTHTMGTMVGDDGAGNQIGVAPGATWIAVKGCEYDGCSDTALFAAGQWILAPTDLTGANPRPDLRPNIVNNSWGDGGGNFGYQQIVQAWNAAGIFPQFSIGNAGPNCGTAGSPGDYAESYAAGAFDSNNAIAEFSSRGPATTGLLKPNISAPGVDIRSSVPGDYSWFSGTSMASPHVAATVALMWSAAPALFGDVAATRAVLDQTAIDADDTSCGGDPTNNNVWGEGRLDAFLAVEQSPRGPTGELSGTVTDAVSGVPIADARISAVGAFNRTTRTDPDGAYTLLLPVGPYEVSASGFGYVPATALADIAEGITTTLDLALQPAPRYPVSGTVRDTTGAPIADALVTILDTPLPPAITDAAGFYSFASVPEGAYDVQVTPSSCYERQSQALTVAGSTTLDFTITRRVDGFGYMCMVEEPTYSEGDTPFGLAGDDNAASVALPFPFPFYGQVYDTAYVSTNGFVNFLELNANLGNLAIPEPFPPNAAIYAFWDDLYVDYDTAMYTGLIDDAAGRRFVIEWRNVHFCCVSGESFDVAVELYPNGDIRTQYRNIDDNTRERGDSATLGIENAEGTIGLQFAYNEAILAVPAFTVRYDAPPSGIVQGSVTDAVDTQPIAGATVQVYQGDSLVRAAQTNAEGVYRLALAPGNYRLEATAANYTTATAEADLSEGALLTRDFSLLSARAAVSPARLDFFALAGQTRTATITLANSGLVDLQFSLGAPLDTSPPAYPAPVAPQIARSHGDPSARALSSVEPSVAAEDALALVLMDSYPWGSDALLQLLAARNIPYDVAGTEQMTTIDLNAYQVVFVAGDQSPWFYDTYRANLSRFEQFVQSGGTLWFNAAAWGYSGGDLNGTRLPGGALIQGPLFEDYNEVAAPAHPLMIGVANPFYGTSASHGAFAELPAGATVIARAQASRLPTLIEYPFGAGKVLALMQPLEYAAQVGQDAGRILDNSVPYVLTTPWLTTTPRSGTVPPDGVQAIQVTVNTAGLSPGMYQAGLFIYTNDPRNPTLMVPVELVVSAYQQALNAGGSAYTDRTGDVWAADRRYVAGSWGFTNPSARAVSVRKPIAGTDDDPLYQTLRDDPVEYRFDGLPAGTYEVELRFADLTTKKAGQRIFDVYIEGRRKLPVHDIVGEEGALTADMHTFYVTVSDGQLNIRFAPYAKGYQSPIINAIRVTNRPDR
jgi:subtilisin family serine protease